MRHRRHFPRFAALMLGLALLDARGQALVGREAEEPIQLSELEVVGDAEEQAFDRTGMGSYEQQLTESPFGGELVATEPVEDEVVSAQLIQIATPSAVDLATGDTRLSLRGFPTPLLRNGFAALGTTDMLNTSRTVVIQGALVPVMGRAAPGGIQDFWSARPRTTRSRRLEFSASTERVQTAGVEVTGVWRPKQVWHRVAATASRREGPEPFASNLTLAANVGLTWKHSRTLSSFWTIDVQQIRAVAAPGIPEYRTDSGQKILGPYLPLAGFNVFGPEAGVRRRTASASVWLDAQPRPWLAWRAGLEAWWRTMDQDRFTTGVYNVARGRFEGTREPRHVEQPQQFWLAHVEATARFAWRRTQHKVMLAASQTWASLGREERALTIAERDLLPVDVRTFVPEAPNYFRPPYDPLVYGRVLTDRDEDVRYTALEVSERASIAGGRTVMTAGLRQDLVDLHLTDRRPGNTLPRVADRVRQLTYHAGVNHQLRPGRLLLFASTSTAFEPSTRVDVRTGRIQGNDTTRGYEAGLKSRSWRGTLDLSGSAFLLYNQDISRRNPLYDDPIFDANQTQPQLVAAGEERFSGAKAEARWKPKGPWTFSARGTYTHAVTTASPDLPAEVGRPITRLPAYTAMASAAYSIDRGPAKGLTLSGAWSYVSGFVAQYADAQRAHLQFPGYGLVTLGANWPFKRQQRTHVVGLSLRNAGGVDLVRKQARLGNGRELVASYRLTF